MPSPEQRLIASMVRHNIELSPENYTLWQLYLGGTEPRLRRTIDIFLSNGCGLDHAVLRSLHKRFCSRDHERDAMHAATRTIQQRVEALAASEEASQPMQQRLAALARDIGDMIRLGDRLLAKLDQSALQIAEVEKSLGEARHEATTDGLTGLSNRRAFDVALRGLAGGAMNSGEDLALVLLDIDHFKAVNDRWGHRTGDDVLRTVADTLSRTVRGGDRVARYGGEEFAITLPQTTSNGALAVAENVRLAIEAQPVRITLDLAAKPTSASISINVTVSLGISIYDPGETLADWVGRADNALYLAKRQGRNRVAFGDAIHAASGASELHGQTALARSALN